MSDEDFCLLHGRAFMQSEFGNPVAHCSICEAEQSARKHIAEIGTKLEQERAKNAQMREALVNAIPFVASANRSTIACDCVHCKTQRRIEAEIRAALAGATP